MNITEGNLSLVTKKQVVKPLLSSFLTVIFLLDSLHLSAQKSEVQFEMLAQSIGNLLIEKDTLIHLNFCFFNKGKYPIKVRYQTSSSVNLIAYDTLITGKKKSCLKVAYQAIPNRGEVEEKILLYLENAIPQVALLDIQGHIYDKSKMYEVGKEKVFLDKKSLHWKISQTDTLLKNNIQWFNQSQNIFQIRVVKAPSFLKPLSTVILDPSTSQIVEFTCDPHQVQHKSFSTAKLVLEIQGTRKIQQEIMIITEYLISDQHLEQTLFEKAPLIMLESDTLRYHNSKNKYSLRLYNRGTGTLKIDNIIQSCGCLSTAIESNTIPSKDSTLLYFEFSSQFKKKENINIYSNDPKKPVILIHVIKDSK